MADDKPVTSSGNEDLDELGELLDSTAREFKTKPGNTDDELDDLMATADQQAAQKAAGEFQMMLQQMVQVQEEAIRKNEAEAKEGGEPAADMDDETKQMMDAMQKLLSCTGQVANAQSEEEFIAGMDMLRSPDGNMEPFMSMIMQSLVSKDVMYPPLKEIHSNYPKYLEDNRGELDPETLQRYEKQFEVLGRICNEFEKQPDPSPEVQEPVGDVASAAQEAPDMSNFEVLGMLLMELQSLGYPPKELTGDLPEGWAVDDATGMPKVENVEQAADACSIM